MSVTPYTTREYVEKRISQVGTEDRIDDDISSINMVLEEATIEVQGYLLNLYSDTALQTSNWVRLRTTDIAVYFLCLRRANSAPTSVKERYDNAISELREIMEGARTIAGLAMSKSTGPVMTNQRVDLMPFPRVVNVQSRSTGKQEGYYPNNDTRDVDPRE